ncbi:general substrate transporter [Microdochium trichocladiopsis]|uniref:General substrate transporter n=1 Tax=Microdochium trichocladiopsis TaxID=1682393 RepID=A0A9P8Y7L2_9PEZI|nr:general substrate transporter [Microdochium trichocladiopsis]KAH7029631.1 general substrate transporter [Microdochium trichocladiopsis]
MSTTKESPSATIDTAKAESEHYDAFPTEYHDDRSFWQICKENPAIIGYTICANFSPLLFGYDGLALGVIIALPAFSFDFGEPFGLWTAGKQIGIMIGAGANGYLQDRFGRKPMTFVGWAVATLSVALGYTSYMPDSYAGRRTQLLMAKVIVGLGMGILMSTCQTYVSEIAPVKIRGMLLGIYTLVLVVGQTIAVSVVFSRIAIMDRSAYLVPIALQWMFAGLVFIRAVLIPESPSFLVSKGRVEEAARSFDRLYGKGERSPNNLIATVAQERQQENNKDVRFMELFQGTNFRRTRIVWLLNITQQFTGISLLANATYFLIQAGMNPAQSLEINQIGISLSIPCILLSYYTMQKFSRRFIILTSMITITVRFIGMGITGLFPNDKTALKFVGVTLLLSGFVGAHGLNPAYNVVASEVSSVRLRARTLSSGFVIYALASWVFSFTVPYMFNPDVGNLSAKIGWVFVGLGTIGIVLVWFEVPETRNKSYAQLDLLFERKTKTRDFKRKMDEELSVPA